MKDFNKTVQLVVLLTIGFTLGSCSDEDVDNAKPMIHLVAPANDGVLHIGGEVHFDCEFADDVELRSYKIEIHNNFDGHSHGSAVLKSANEEHGHPWSYTNTWNFEAGKKNEDVHHHAIQIPETILVNGVEEPTAEGEYHFGVYCVDVAGNENKVFVSVVIEHGVDEYGH